MTQTMTFPASYISESTENTEKLGKELARHLSAEGSFAFVAMYGDLGVGKTAFVRGFCSYFGDARVKSPTFSIVNEYRFDSTSVFHFDMYRITDDEDLYSTGYYEYLERDGYVLCEWCENIPFAIPEDAYVLHIDKIAGEENTEKRSIRIEKRGA